MSSRSEVKGRCELPKEVLRRVRAACPWLAALALVVGGIDLANDGKQDQPDLLMRVDARSSPQAHSVERARATSSWVNPEDHTKSSHASSVAVLADGSLATIWYGGAREGAADVCIYLSRRAPGTEGHWSEPEVLVAPEGAEAETGRNVRKLGNAVLFADPKGDLWVVYVSVSVGGWSGSVLNARRSQDNGVTWSETERFSVSPFFNFSTLVRAKPFFSDDGWIALPVYSEFIHKYPQVLWFKPGADRLVEQYQVRVPSGTTDLLQPAIVPLDQRRAVMLLRDSGPARSLHRAYSEDGGWTWSEPTALKLDNADSGLDAVSLPDGRLLVAYNEGHAGRNRLRLAVSSDAGQSWRAARYVEEHESGEYSYPSLVVDQAGVVHLTYTWRRERIRHLSFHPRWLDGSELYSSIGTP